MDSGFKKFAVLRRAQSHIRRIQYFTMVALVFGFWEMTLSHLDPIRPGNLYALSIIRMALHTCAILDNIAQLPTEKLVKNGCTIYYPTSTTEAQHSPIIQRRLVALKETWPCSLLLLPLGQKKPRYRPCCLTYSAMELGISRTLETAGPKKEALLYTFIPIRRTQATISASMRKQIRTFPRCRFPVVPDTRNGDI